MNFKAEVTYRNQIRMTSGGAGLYSTENPLVPDVIDPDRRTDSRTLSPSPE